VKTGGTIAVAGATGRVGRHVVDLLEEQGHDVVLNRAARRLHGDRDILLILRRGSP
jgi:nucleoside-diphosphate-sugar epimerase